MDWTAGYASDVEYTAGFYLEQSPAYLNFVCILNGVEPVALDKSFTYFELGFGRGLTVNLLAAANPQGQFYAADFNPAHVAGARELAASAQLTNLTLFEDSFEELANGKEKDLPQFDFITLHGIYTWVTSENQQNIVNFIARYLKPGGVVYLSYNAMPGWASALPLQRLLVEHADAFPNRSNLQVKAAADLVQKLEATAANYIVANPSLKPRLETLKTANPNYLVHEYMHKHWAPRYHADIARDLATAKMDYVGSADLPLAYPALYLNEEKQAIVNTMNDAAMRETMKDYFLNTGFRKDVFIRGSRKLNALKQAEYLLQIGLILLVPRSDFTMSLKLGIGEINLRADLYGPVLDALALRPHTLAELKELPALQNQSLGNLTQVVALLSASGKVAFYSTSSAMQPNSHALKMNQVLANMARYGDEYQAMSSSLLGNGFVIAYIERLVFLKLQELGAEADAQALTQGVWTILASQGRRMMKEGVAIEGEAENKAELASQIAQILAAKLPLWKQLRMI